MKKLKEMSDKMKEQLSQVFNVPVEILDGTVVEDIIFERYTNPDSSVNSTVRVTLRNGELIEKQMQLDEDDNGF